MRIKVEAEEAGAVSHEGDEILSTTTKTASQAELTSVDEVKDFSSSVEAENGG